MFKRIILASVALLVAICSEGCQTNQEGAFPTRDTRSTSHDPEPDSPPRVLWRAGMETGNLSEWSNQVNTGSARSVAVTAASAGVPPISGSWVMQQSVTGSSGGTRMARLPEIEALTREGTTFYVSWWDYFPTKISFGPRDYFNLWQVASRDAVTRSHPIWTLFLGGSNATLSLAWDPARKGFAGPHAGETGKKEYRSKVVLPVRQWVFFEVMVTPASDFTGAIKVWMNGELLFQLSQVRTRLPDEGLGGAMYVTHNAYGTNLKPVPATHYVDDVTISLGRMPMP